MQLKNFLLAQRNNADPETVKKFAERFNQLTGTNLGNEVSQMFFDKRNNKDALKGLDSLISSLQNPPKATKESKKPTDTDEVDSGLKKEKTNEEASEDWEFIEKESPNEIADQLKRLAINGNRTNKSNNSKTKNRKKKQKAFPKIKPGFLL